MFTQKKWAIGVCVLVCAALIIPIACSTPPATPQVVVQTQVVKQTVPVEVTKVVQQTVPVVVTKVVEKDPRVGGVYKMAIPAAIGSLDPMSAAAVTSQEVTWPVLEMLVVFGEDFKVVPMLAESWTVSTDGKTCTLSLRQGVKFHNGKEMTSDDVLASLKRFLDVTTRKSQFTALQSYVAKDKYTVVLTLSNPDPAFLEYLAHPFPAAVIMPKEVIEGKKDIKPEDLIGTGPYKLAEYKADQYVRYTRYADYKPLPGDKSGYGGAKVAFFDEVQIIPVPDTGARVAVLETVAYDWAEAVPMTEFNRLSAVPGVKVYQTALDWDIVLFLNHANKFSSNLKFRQALAAALDMDAIGMSVTNGLKQFYTANDSLWIPSSQFYYQSTLSKQVYNEKNLDKAKQLLKESGYNGEEIVVATTRDYDWLYRTLASVTDQLKKNLGMNIRVDVMDWAALNKKWAEKDTWHISCSGIRSPAIFAPQNWGLSF